MVVTAALCEAQRGSMCSSRLFHLRARCGAQAVGNALFTAVEEAHQKMDFFDSGDARVGLLYRVVAGLQQGDFLLRWRLCPTCDYAVRLALRARSCVWLNAYTATALHDATISCSGRCRQSLNTWWRRAGAVGKILWRGHGTLKKSGGMQSHMGISSS